MRARDRDDHRHLANRKYAIAVDDVDASVWPLRLASAGDAIELAARHGLVDFVGDLPDSSAAGVVADGAQERDHRSSGGATHCVDRQANIDGFFGDRAACRTTGHGWKEGHLVAVLDGLVQLDDGVIARPSDTFQERLEVRVTRGHCCDDGVQGSRRDHIELFERTSRLHATPTEVNHPYLHRSPLLGRFLRAPCPSACYSV